jgi:hypothetical protein
MILVCRWWGRPAGDDGEHNDGDGNYGESSSAL